MNLIVDPEKKRYVLACKGKTYRCAIGRGGLVEAEQKQEGDGATPLGVWPLRAVLYRPDRSHAPVGGLSAKPLFACDGWCDDPGDEAYNTLVMLPYKGRHEKMWRDDELYDVVVVLGYNDDPPVRGKGSAIFLHCAKPGYSPTEGCIALGRPDLLEVLSRVNEGDSIEIRSQRPD